MVGSAVEISDASVRHDNHALLVDDLRRRSLVFESRPVEAHIQFSTYCNMSCVMCWDGANPPVVDMDPTLAAKITEQLGPELALVIPHDGSEPTARGWGDLVDWARSSRVRLEVTTNVQGLSERRLRDAADVIDSLHLSVDSHDPDILAAIRPGSRPRAIYRNLANVVAVAAELGIHCQVTAVYMVQNALGLPATVSAFAAIGVREMHVIPLVDTNGRSRSMDPRVELDPVQRRELRAEVVNTARAAEVLLWWGVDEPELIANDRSEPWERLAGSTISGRALEANGPLVLTNPGYCRFVHSAVRIDVDGGVAPCGYSAAGELELGSLRRDDFDDIWNGPNARDLRRAMVTRDLPALCSTCAHAALPPEQDELGVVRAAGEPASDAGGVEVERPEHGTRCVEPPTFAIRERSGVVDDVRLHISLGDEDPKEVALPRSSSHLGRSEWAMPLGEWVDLHTNLGYWWMLSAEIDGRRERLMHSARVLIRHQAMPRVDGSTLNYEGRAIHGEAVPVSIAGPDGGRTG